MKTRGHYHAGLRTALEANFFFDQAVQAEGRRGALREYVAQASLRGVTVDPFLHEQIDREAAVRQEWLDDFTVLVDDAAFLFHEAERRDRDQFRLNILV
jgi:hypothetical protein